MATDKHEIANLALGILGQDASVVNFDTDGTREANLIKLHYDACRLFVLRSYPWRFARTRADLTSPGTPSIDDWAYEYTLPAGTLRLLQIENDVDFQYEEGKILTDQAEPLRVYLVTDRTTTTDYPSSFTEALSHYIAWKICIPLTQEIGLKKQLWEDFKNILRSARFVDSTEGPEHSLRTETWLDSRQGFYPGFVRDTMT